LQAVFIIKVKLFIVINWYGTSGMSRAVTAICGEHT